MKSRAPCPCGKGVAELEHRPWCTTTPRLRVEVRRQRLEAIIAAHGSYAGAGQLLGLSGTAMRTWMRLAGYAYHTSSPQLRVLLASRDLARLEVHAAAPPAAVEVGA